MSGMEFDPRAQVVCTRSTWFVRERDHNELPMPMPVHANAHVHACPLPMSSGHLAQTASGHPLQTETVECKRRGSSAFLLP